MVLFLFCFLFLTMAWCFEWRVNYLVETDWPTSKSFWMVGLSSFCPLHTFPTIIAILLVKKYSSPWSQTHPKWNPPCSNCKITQSSSTCMICKIRLSGMNLSPTVSYFPTCLSSGMHRWFSHGHPRLISRYFRFSCVKTRWFNGEKLHFFLVQKWDSTIAHHSTCAFIYICSWFCSQKRISRGYLLLFPFADDFPIFPPNISLSMT